jgi:PIN domain nuclease of toxin-antitoxin system
MWWARNERLSRAAKAAIADPATEVFVSSASVWEAGVKAAAGRLRLGRDLGREAGLHGFRELPIGFAHAVEAARLPPHHGDPFDRMLIAQARLEELTIVTRDVAFSDYDVPLLAA